MSDRVGRAGGVGRAVEKIVAADRWRRRGFLGVLCAVVLSIALGPLLAGVIVSRWGWSAVFWARAPIALADGQLIATASIGVAMAHDAADAGDYGQRPRLRVRLRAVAREKQRRRG